MDVLSRMEEYDHEQVVFCQDKAAGLKAIIAIHDTTLGPALGGTRMWNYASEEEALRDVLRLSRGMTHKACAAGLNLGGGKAVIIGDPKKDKTEVLFRAYGRFVNSLGGRYITAEDVGTDVNDMEYAFTETDYVVGIESSHGGSGNPAPFTALGVFQAIKASLAKVYGKEDLNGRIVAVQGVGQVGSHLIRRLKTAGAKIFATDIDLEKLKAMQVEMGFEIVSAKEIYSVPCDIFVPCALGGVLNDETIPLLKCKIIAGSSNNQLEKSEHGEALKERGILYAPDYVVNAGGLINVYQELEGYSRERAERMTRGIYYNLKRVFQISDELGISTEKAAAKMVDQRLNQLRQISSSFQQTRKTALTHVHDRFRSHS
ncbi:MAG: Glu/Leu/Phe/Val dehydrogenase [Deltaproteobacteria bacterium]|nr:Glu/Leu/Phe/Val dehydrogenase [Deltaproteobacteria bacterium]